MDCRRCGSGQIYGLTHGSDEEILAMVKYVRCNAILSLALDASGVGCRYMAKADTEEGALEDMSKHLVEVHEVEADELSANIKASTKTTRG